MRGIVIAGTHSGCGKTTITLGILAALKKKGYTVQPFKAGPDFIDTGLHKLITGRTSRNLDLWMCGEDYVAECFYTYVSDADIAVVEGVMGMYDGKLSTANLAASLGLPVILVVDGYGMAESAGAIVRGFRAYSSEVRVMGYEVRNKKDSNLLTPDYRLSIAGVIFNRVASERHYKRLKESVKDVPVMGYLPRDLDFEIPHRHLGLVVAEESPLDKEKIDKLADVVLEHIDIERIIQDSGYEIQGSRFRTPNTKLPTHNSKLSIAVAYDKAFCFYYEDNLDLLKEAGAEIIKFSPLSDSAVPPEADALYIGGGYPELYAEQLSANKTMLNSVKAFADSGKVIYAECGGFMYLTEGIYDFDDALYPMTGVFPFKTRMLKGRARLGYREVELKADSIFGAKGTKVRGHEFHYSEILKSDQEVDLLYSVKDGEGNYIYDEGRMIKNTLGSYIHIHFGSNREIAKNFIQHIVRSVSLSVIPAKAGIQRKANNLDSASSAE